MVVARLFPLLQTPIRQTVAVPVQLRALTQRPTVLARAACPIWLRHLQPYCRMEVFFLARPRAITVRADTCSSSMPREILSGLTTSDGILRPLFIRTTAPIRL